MVWIRPSCCVRVLSQPPHFIQLQVDGLSQRLLAENEPRVELIAFLSSDNKCLWL